MTQTIEDETRTQIAKFLPDAIARALKSYEAFAALDQPGTESKEFAAHHSAAKAAIAHIHLLIKLAQWAELPDPLLHEESRTQWMSELLNQAKGDVADFESEER